jgi:hypothetical protein
LQGVHVSFNRLDEDFDFAAAAQTDLPSDIVTDSEMYDSVHTAANHIETRLDYSALNAPAGDGALEQSVESNGELRPDRPW